MRRSTGTPELPAAVEEFTERAEAIRRDMGGPARKAALEAAGRRNARERIDELLDPGSFTEIGTFVRSERPEDAGSTPGDGKIGGHGRVDGRPVTVICDDITVKRASTAASGSKKSRRLYDLALGYGHPFVHFGETGGARIPDIMGSEGFVSTGPVEYPNLRSRRIPLVTVITGESFGGSSFMAAASDCVIQVAGSCLAITSPRVISSATGEELTMEELGGTGVHSRDTGMIDLAAEDESEAIRLVRAYLSYLPSNAHTPPPRAIGAEPEPVAMGEIVPEARRRAWDVHKLIDALADPGSVLELAPLFGRSLVTAFARLDGRPVGIVANNPMRQAGVLTPDACDKAVRFICTCDAFGLPLLFFHDTPGFMIGRQVEHRRMLSKAMAMQQAVRLAGVPKLSVIVRKSYGVANYAMCGIGMGADLLCAWPGAEISFMDPETAANVLAPAANGDAEAAARRAEVAEQVTADIAPYGAAGVMRVDEIIAPDDTRAVLRATLERCDGRPFQPGSERPLASWPCRW